MILGVNDEPRLVLDGWVWWAAAGTTICSFLVAVVAFFRKVALPLAELVAAMKKDLPVLRDIAETFGERGEETISAELRALAANDEISAANQKAMLARLDAVAAKADTIEAKLSETRHSIIGDITALRAGAAGTVTLVEQLERTSSSLQEVRTQLAAVVDQLPPKEARDHP